MVSDHRKASDVGLVFDCCSYIIHLGSSKTLYSLEGMYTTLRPCSLAWSWAAGVFGYHVKVDRTAMEMVSSRFL